MLQKKTIWKAFKEAGVLDSTNENTQKLVKHIKLDKDHCWRDFSDDFRKNFYDCFDEIVPPLLEIDDPLIRLALVKYLDPSKPKEKEALARIAKSVNPEIDEVSVKYLARSNEASVTKELKRKLLPDKLKIYLTQTKAIPAKKKVSKRTVSKKAVK